jgi:hypothetical protein
MKKNVMENYFSWSYGGQIWGQKSTHTKNGPKSSELGIFHREKAQSDENKILYKILTK